MSLVTLYVETTNGQWREIGTTQLELVSQRLQQLARSYKKRVKATQGGRLIDICG